MFWESLWRRLSRALFEQDRWKMYLEGLGNTLIIAFIATLIGTTIGVIFAMIKSAKADKNDVNVVCKNSIFSLPVLF